MLRSIAYNYPEFQSLPRGIKKMLVVTESFFFGEENRCRAAHVHSPMVTVRDSRAAPRRNVTGSAVFGIVPGRLPTPAVASISRASL